MKRSSNKDESKIKIYENETELFEDIRRLLQDKQYFGIDELVVASAGNSIFRAFHHKKVPPSGVYRKWAAKQLKDKHFLRRLLKINSQPKYDDWHNRLCNSFKQYWEREMKIKDQRFFGPSRKLPDVLMKIIVLLWDKIPERKRLLLLKYIHIPLDSYVLEAMKHLIPIKDIVKPPKGKGLTMSSVDTLYKYKKIQNEIRSIADKANIHPIYLDLLLWNKRALNI